MLRYRIPSFNRPNITSMPLDSYHVVDFFSIIIGPAIQVSSSGYHGKLMEKVS